MCAKIDISGIHCINLTNPSLEDTLMAPEIRVPIDNMGKFELKQMLPSDSETRVELPKADSDSHDLGTAVLVFRLTATAIAAYFAYSRKHNQKTLTFEVVSDDGSKTKVTILIETGDEKSAVEKLATACALKASDIFSELTKLSAPK